VPLPFPLAAMSFTLCAPHHRIIFLFIPVFALLILENGEIDGFAITINQPTGFSRNSFSS